MANELRRAVLFTVVSMALVGAYHVVLWGVGRTRVPRTGRGQPVAASGRDSRRLGADRPEIHDGGVLSAAAVGRGLQRRVDWWVELRTVESGPSQGRAGAA